MPSYVIINGEMVRYELARLPLHDRGLLSGLALMEAIRVESAVPLRLEAHVDKLAASISSPETALDFAINSRQLARDIAALCAKEDVYDCIAHYILTPGEEKPWAVDKPAAGSILYIEPLDKFTVWQQKGVGVMPSPYLKVRGNPFSQHNFVAEPLQACALKMAAKQKFEIVAYADQDGNLLDTSEGALFIVHEGSLLVPHIQRDGVRNSVYRELAIECAAREGMVLYQQSLTPEVCAAASEMFIASSGCIIAPVTEIAGRKFRENPIACKMLLSCRGRLDREKPLL